MDKQKDDTEVVLGEGTVVYVPGREVYFIKWDSGEIDTTLDTFLSDEYKDLKYKGKKVKLIIREVQE